MFVLLVMTAVTMPLVLYLPGWAITRAFPAAVASDGLERHYERVVISMLLSGWLALLLAELGLFSLWLLLLLLLAIGALAFKKQGGPSPRLPLLIRRRPHFSRESLAFALVALVALLLVARPFETVLGGRDAGVYANTGFAMARTGSLVLHDALVSDIGRAAQSADRAVREPAEQALSNFLGVQNPHRYIATRMRAAGFFINAGDLPDGRVVPQFFHLFPAWIALLTSMGGVYIGLFAPGLMGLVGAWSVGMLGRRLAGMWVGLLAFLLLALNSVQVWFSRYSTSETTAQFLTFAGLYFFVKCQAPPAGADGVRSDGRWFFAALAGVAFGQLALTRIDFFLVIGPLLAYLLYCWLSRRWHAVQTALAAGLGAMLVHAGLHILLVARAYFFDTGFDRFRDYAITAYLALPFLTQAQRDAYTDAGVFADPLRLWRELALLLLLVGALLLVRRYPQPLRIAEALLLRWRAWLLTASALALVLLAGYAYLVRPRIIDSDILFNTRGGWNDPLTRDPRLVQQDVNEWRMSMDMARTQAGVVLLGDPEYAATAVDAAATAALRAQLRAERGPWAGPFSNQTFNWLRLQGYVGAPIALPRIFYDDGQEWWREYAEDVPPGVEPPTGLPVREKEIIPLANLVRVGWYLSPLGLLLAVPGLALWWRRDMQRGTWLFFLIALLGTFFWVRQTYGTSDQTYIYILRRFVSVTYPALSLGMAYAIVALAGRTAGRSPGPQREWVGTAGFAAPAQVPGLAPVGRVWRMPRSHLLHTARRSLALLLAALLVLFLVWTGRPIYRHVEYAGAVDQLTAFAGQFAADDVLLLRGGGPDYATARDVPDIIATPLRFLFDRNAFTVKSSQPGAYADALAAQVRVWQDQGRTVYVVLSASGGNFVLPGYALQPVEPFNLQLREFEQLTDQKPRNVARLNLPFAVYRLTPSEPEQLTTLPPPVNATDFAAQVQGFYLPEVPPGTPAAALFTGQAYAWTSGDAVLRLPWPQGSMLHQLELRLAGGPRPASLEPARLCLSVQAETRPWPVTPGEPVPVGCLALADEMQTYRISLDLARLPRPASGSLLLYLESQAWIPAEVDPDRHDQRTVGVQFAELSMQPATAAASGCSASGQPVPAGGLEACAP